ncbi:MAG: type I 3-dehydroquinate dehydratase [Eggerthellaceae bacterium]
MQHMLEMGADIPKIAVWLSPQPIHSTCFPPSRKYSAHGDAPLSLWLWGAGSLVALGEVFGSAMTFCALKAASAPGQVDLALARSIMSGIHHIHSNQS